jgi:hypothetical protein
MGELPPARREQGEICAPQGRTAGPGTGELTL